MTIWQMACPTIDWVSYFPVSMPLYEVCTPLLLLQLATNNVDWRTSCRGVEARKIDTQPVVLAHEHVYTSSIFWVFSTVELKVFWAHAIVQWRGNCAEVMGLMADETHDLSTTSQVIEIRYMVTSKLTNTHLCNAVPLVWGSPRLTPITTNSWEGEGKKPDQWTSFVFSCLHSPL